MSTQTLVDALPRTQVPPIPFHRPAFEDSDVETLVETVRSGWWSSGPVGRELESILADYLGRRHVVVVSSATAALQLLYRAAGVGPGDEVLTSPWTFVSTAEVAVHLGATPVFADVEDDTLNLSVEAAAQRIGPRTKVLAPVHFGGRLCDMASLQELASRHDAKVVEDAAHSLSTRVMGVSCGEGSFGAALSFYATKELALGEGGAVVTDDDALAEQVRSWALHGMTRSSWTRARGGRPATYDVESLGYKMNLPDVLAALGVRQATRLDRDRARRRAVARVYDEILAGIDGLRVVGRRDGQELSHHLYVVRIDAARTGIHRDDVAQELAREGVQTSVHFVPLHTMTIFREQYGTRAEDCPVASRAAREVLSLPIYPGLGVDRAAAVARRLRRILLRGGR